MHKISNTEKYQKELAIYEQKLSEIRVPNVRKEIEKLVRELKNHVMLIDNGHDTFATTKVNPLAVRENVEEATRIRRKLKQIFKL